MNNAKYICTRDGNGTWSVAFGPFRDLSPARVAVSRLEKRGVNAKVVAFDEAKKIDHIGVSRLGQKCIDE